MLVNEDLAPPSYPRAQTVDTLTSRPHGGGRKSERGELSLCFSQKHTIHLVLQPLPVQMTGPNLTNTETVTWA